MACFSALAHYYKEELTQHLHQSLGYLALKNGDFFILFWKAWVSTFTQETILSSFEATGISPPNPHRVLNRFAPDDSDASESSGSSTSVYSGKDWLKIQSLIREIAKDESTREVRKLRRSLHHLAATNEILSHEVAGLTEAMKVKVKHRKKRKVLPLHQPTEGGWCYILLPHSKARAEQLLRDREHEEEEHQHQKQERQRIRADNKLLKEWLAEERRVAREAAKIVREKEKAEQAAKRERQKQARDAAKAIQSSQEGKRQASRPPTQKSKRQKRVVDVADRREAAEALPAPPSVTTRRGRNVTLPSKYK